MLKRFYYEKLQLAFSRERKKGRSDATLVTPNKGRRPKKQTTRGIETPGATKEVEQPSIFSINVTKFQ